MKKFILLIVLPILAHEPLFACGGYEYEGMLINTGEQMLESPETLLVSEIRRLSPKTEFVRPTVASKDSLGNERMVGVPEAEAFDGVLEKSLKQAGEPEDKVHRLIAEYRAYRKAAANPNPDARTTIPDQLPQAFKLYEEGAEHWHRQDYPEAAKCWNRLLALPEAQRRLLEAPTCLMLAKFALEEKRPEDARAWIEALRKAVRSGAPDPTGYAAATYQLERHLAGNDWEKLENLLVQSGANMDETFVLRHIQLHCRRILSSSQFYLHESAVREAVAHPLVRRLITAYVLSRGGPSYDSDDAQRDKESDAWLRVLGEIGGDLPEAGQIAAIAYQRGNYTMAERWLNRAPKTDALAAIIASRLLLREGQQEHAAGKLAAAMPKERVMFTSPDFPESKNFFPMSDERKFLTDEFTGRAAAELAVLHLAGQRHEEALDLFLRTGLYRDAAVVAERFFSTDELVKFIAELKPVRTVENSKDPVQPPYAPYLKTLLARRLMREDRPDTAAGYFSGANRKVFDTYRELSKKGYDANLPARERAKAFFRASVLVADEGESLFRSESGPRRRSRQIIDPDAPVKTESYWSNQFSPENLRTRIGGGSAQPLPELRDRIMAFRAGELALYAASLLPDNDEESAYMLWRAGRALSKEGQPQSANVFYKLLCLRHPGTELGKAALKNTWFPDFTANDETLKATPPPAK